MGSFKELKAYQISFQLSMEIFNITKTFPQGEQYSLTSQIIRSSRSVCASIGEGYRKRRYKAHFISKLSDADMENTKTQVLLHFALECSYISQNEYEKLMNSSEQIGKLIQYMIKNAEKFGVVDFRITANCQLETVN